MRVYFSINGQRFDVLAVRPSGAFRKGLPQGGFSRGLASATTPLPFRSPWNQANHQDWLAGARIDCESAWQRKRQPSACERCGRCGKPGKPCGIGLNLIPGGDTFKPAAEAAPAAFFPTTERMDHGGDPIPVEAFASF